MTPEQLESVTREITNTIRVVVNGKIDKLTEQVKVIHSRLDEQDIAIKPAIDTISTIRNGVNFTKWIWPVFLILGGIIAWIKS